MRKQIISLDFDGVVHQYDGKWTSPSDISGPPVLGVAKAIEDYRRAGFAVVIHSSRLANQEAIRAMDAWLRAHIFMADIPLLATKPPATVIIDDRCICFDGRHWPTVEELRAFKPWWKR